MVFAVFPRQVVNLTVDDIAKDAADLYSETRKLMTGWWPRGIAVYFIIPVYCSKTFSPEVVNYVHRKPKHKLGIWHEPVLYSTSLNNADIPAEYGFEKSACLPIVLSAVECAIVGVSAQFKPVDKVMINNGQEVKYVPEPLVQRLMDLAPDSKLLSPYALAAIWLFVAQIILQIIVSFFDFTSKQAGAFYTYNLIGALLLGGCSSLWILRERLHMGFWDKVLYYSNSCAFFVLMLLQVLSIVQSA